MSLYDSFVKPVAFQFDAEWVHEKAMAMIGRGLFRARPFADPRLEQNLFGVKFSNPIGLAAGFDKNAVALNQWQKLGFGAVECGTVTNLAQPGNERPRLFRLPAEEGLINRMGFNNDGAAEVALRIAKSGPGIPLGINLGKSKITPVERAAEDYRESYRALHTFGQYFVVNVSSPNTPGLRELQDKAALTEILRAIQEVDSDRPLFVKVAPDLERSALDELLTVAIDSKLTGIIATNTTIDRSMLTKDPGQAGGLSGRPVRARSNEMLAYLARNAPQDMVLIGVGGIFTAEDLYQKIRLGAHLCQVYTGWVYGGPQMIPTVLEGLVCLMERDGVKNLSELRCTGLKYDQEI